VRRPTHGEPDANAFHRLPCDAAGLKSATGSCRRGAAVAGTVPSGSDQNVVHDIPGNVGQAEVAAAVAVG
jgi:hypothetical protein